MKTPQTSNNIEPDLSLGEIDWDNLSEEDKRFLWMEHRLESKMRESVKEGIKESMQEVIDNTLTAAMSTMTDKVHELIKKNCQLLHNRLPYMHWNLRTKH